MEFINGGHQKLSVSNDCSYIILNDVVENTTSISFFNRDSGKFQTHDHKIKFSKESLYLYDTDNNLLEEYKFKKFLQEVEEVQKSNIVKKFMVKKEVYIFLKKIGDDMYLQNDSGQFKVVSKSALGNYYDVYEDSEGNILHVSNNISFRNSKYNGSPVGEIH